MKRLACIELPVFPLQVLLKARPEWRSYPVAVVDQDRPQGILLYVNEYARKRGVDPGMRYSAGLMLAMNLQAAEVSPEQIGLELETITNCLRAFSPDVEPFADSPGTFWLNASGLGSLYPSEHDWATEIKDKIEKIGYECCVVIGFTKFRTLASARFVATGSSILIFQSQTEEFQYADGVLLNRSEVPIENQKILHSLGIKTLGDLARLPQAGMKERFGQELYQMARLMQGDLWDPMVVEPELPKFESEKVIEPPESDTIRLMFLIKQKLLPLLRRMENFNRAPEELCIHLFLEDSQSYKEVLRFAYPTLDTRQILRLIHLRLESLQLPCRVDGFALEIFGSIRRREQLQLFRRQQERKLASANQALARIRAEFGNEAVVRARLQDAHLPEARFIWEKVDQVCLPQPKSVVKRSFVRRILKRPVLLPLRLRHERGSCTFVGLGYGAVVGIDGPYIISGGWWSRTVYREYYFMHMEQGDILWVYYDWPRRRWFMQGWVA